MDNGHLPDEHDLEYLHKIEWLWNRLSHEQRSRIRDSTNMDMLRQENSRHCIIGEAGHLNNMVALPRENLLLEVVFCLANTVFYDGPSYDHMLGKRATREEKKILDDIYYAKIGTSQHQYQRANALVKMFMANRMAVV